MHTMNLKIYLWRLLITFLLVHTITLNVFGSGSADTAAFIDEQRVLIKQFQKDSKIKGLAVALFDNERIIWSEGFGHSNPDKKQLIDTETIFSIQSMSKTFIATAIMKTVQDGLIDLDTPITKYLPQFSIHSCYEKNPENKITLRLMLGNTAGFTHEAPIGNNYDASFDSYEQHYISIYDTWLKFPVGKKYSYSNLGFDLAAQIIEKMSGMTFQNYMKRQIFGPLSMTSTTVDINTVLKSNNRTEGKVIGFKKLPIAIPMIGAGGVYTNVTDLVKFVQFHLNFGKVKDKPFIEKKYLYEMYTPIIIEDYALGIGITQEKTTYSFFHQGGGFGFGACMKWYPECKIGSVILTNGGCSPYGIVSKILNNYINRGHASRDTTLTQGFHPLKTFPRQLQRENKNVPNVLEIGMSTYREDWDKYIGTYRFVFKGGFEFMWYADVARFFGYKTPKINIYKRGNRIYLDEYDENKSLGEKELSEHITGLFFTNDGEALDFRSKIPTYRNIELER